MNSIRKRLLVVLLSTFTVVWIVMMTYTWHNTEHEIEEVFDAQLAQATNVLLDLTLYGITEQDLDDFRSDLLGADSVHNYENKVAFQVWRGDHLLLRSRSAPAFPMTQEHGYSNGSIGKLQWRFLRRQDMRSGLIAIVGEEYGVRNELVTKIIFQVFWPVLLALPVLAILVVIGVNRGLFPIRLLANEIGGRSINQLDAVSTNQIPTEVAPLVDSINQLLVRLRRAIDAERHFTSDASHELRTPLAALKAQAQVAQRSDNKEARQHALRSVVEGVNRSSRLIEQLLTLARLEPESVQNSFEKKDLATIVEEVMAQVAITAQEKQIEIDLTRSGKTDIKGISALLDILARNLLENALHYTPQGGEVHVSVASDSNKIVLNVSDSGPGIPQELRDRVFDRFYRVPGSEQSGSGLGLSIVKSIVEIHGGSISISETDSGGGMITVTLPAGLA